MHVWHEVLTVLLNWGPYGLLLLSVLDSLGLPVIGGVDALLVTIATNQPERAYFAAACAVVGSLAGSLILFSIARKGGEILLKRHISGRVGAHLHSWFQRYGLVTVFVPALSPLPLPMKIPVFCAGALNVRVTYFLFVVLTARVIRYAALAYLGRKYGRMTAQYIVQHGLAIGLGALILAVTVAVGIRFYQRAKVQAGEPE